MEPTPPVLTPERIDAMLSRMAEICMGAVEEAGVRLKSAPDGEAFERGGRTLNSACRNLRQSIALKLRFDREQAALAAEQRQVAEAQRLEAKKLRDVAVAKRREQVRDRFRDLLWDEYEYENDDALEMLDGASYRFDLLAEEDPDLLDIPLETLVAKIADILGMNDDYSEDDEDAEDEAPETAEADPPSPPGSG